MNNAYFALRHGRSLANEGGIIVSRPENALAGYGLSAEGRTEVAAKLSPERLRTQGLDFTAAGTVVVSSDFLRARETAELFAVQNGLARPALDARLRERSFGSLEKLPSRENYERVWARDRESATHGDFGCESTADVRARLVALLEDLERRHAGKKIVLVSHGDPLQILETIFAGRPPNEHRLLPHLETAELRALGALNRPAAR